MAIGTLANNRRSEEAPYSKQPKKVKKRRRYIGPWNVRFSCGETDYHPEAASNEIGEMASKIHLRDHPQCHPIRYTRRPKK